MDLKHEYVHVEVGGDSQSHHALTLLDLVLDLV
jgi:hypothetical protein